ncbi:MAG: hypothetical protein ACOX0A_10060 [Thermoguttaceae bacterium]|jgi:hypothetical protein
MKIAAPQLNSSRSLPFLPARVARVILGSVVLLFFTNAVFGQGGQASPSATQGQPQQAQAQTQARGPSPDVAGSQLATFFTTARKEIRGEALPLERLLYGVYSPAERYRRLVAYWDLAGKNAYYNLCVTCTAYAGECATKIENQGSTPETQRFLAAVRLIAAERQSAARLRLLQAQYDFDGAFTSAAGRRAAIARAANSGAEFLDPTHNVVLYLPSARPATDVYQTRYAAMTQYRRASAEAARLNALLPLLYETLQARANQTARELDVLIGLVQSSQVSETSLFDALDRYHDAQRQTIEAAVSYNQAIAAYATQMIPGSVQGAAFLATINQRPSGQSPPTQQRRSESGAAQQEGSANQGTQRSAPDASQSYGYYFPGRLPDGMEEPNVASTPEHPVYRLISSAAADAPSDAAESQVASLASIRPLSNVLSTLASDGTTPASFALVGYETPQGQTPPAPLTSTRSVDATQSPVVAQQLPFESAQSRTGASQQLPFESAQSRTGASQQLPVENTQPRSVASQQLPVENTQPRSVASQQLPVESDQSRTGASQQLPVENTQSQTGASQQPSGGSAQATSGKTSASTTERSTPEGISTPATEESQSKETSEPETEEPDLYDSDGLRDGDILANDDAPLPAEFFLPLPASVPDETESATASGQQDSPDEPDGAFYPPRRNRPLVALLASLGARLTPKRDLSDEYVIRGQEIDDEYFSTFADEPETSDAASANRQSGAANPQSGVAPSQVRDPLRTRELVRALFAVEEPMVPEPGSKVYERLYTLHEIAFRSNQSPEGRYAVATAFWKLQGACARKRIEETIFRNYANVYNELMNQAGANSEATRACLAGALRQEARIAESKSNLRAAQLELLKLMGLSSDYSAYPLPATTPFCGSKFDFGEPRRYNARMRRSAGLIESRSSALQTLGNAMSPPGELLNVDTTNVSVVNSETITATLEKKRESALFFVNQVVELNMSIAEYMAFFPANVSSDQFVDACVR